jgi:lipid II isoglutaminyl synthase (glutamine-hydrolysing)
MILTIAWLYPELMSTYGDRGNVIIFSQRCRWRGIETSILRVDEKTTTRELLNADIILGGGAQDRQQSLVISDLRERKGKVLKDLFDAGKPGLFVCGSPQLLGHTYQMADGTVLKGLGIFDMETKHFGKDKPRCIGNLLCTLHTEALEEFSHEKPTIVGFENHGGRTYLGSGVVPFATVLYGKGNNGEDKTEGAVYKNCIATYSHGPFLSKNPHIADWLIARALNVKYAKDVVLAELDDVYAWKAHDQMFSRYLPKK